LGITYFNKYQTFRSVLDKETKMVIVRPLLTT
jgi:hypothetical protein